MSSFQSERKYGQSFGSSDAKVSSDIGERARESGGVGGGGGGRRYIALLVQPIFGSPEYGIMTAHMAVATCSRSVKTGAITVTEWGRREDRCHQARGRFGTPSDIGICQERYREAQQVNSTVQYLASEQGHEPSH